MSTATSSSTISTTTSTNKRFSSSTASQDANDVPTKKIRVETNTNAENEKNSTSATAIVSPTSGSGKRYEYSDTFSHRAWSEAIRSEENENNAENRIPNHHPSTTYVFRCVFGNHSKPLRSFMKSAPKKWLQNQLKIRQRPTDGTKKVLLHRLQTDLPYVDIEIDDRECLQFLVGSFLHYMDWDAEHSFECSIPNHTPSTIYGSSMGFLPGCHTDGKLSFDPLRNLALVQGSTLNLTYEIGDNHKFTITLLETKERSTTLPETIVSGCPTRVSLVNRSEAKMPNQYTMEIGVAVKDLP